MWVKSRFGSSGQMREKTGSAVSATTALFLAEKVILLSYRAFHNRPENMMMFLFVRLFPTTQIQVCRLLMNKIPRNAGCKALHMGV